MKKFLVLMLGMCLFAGSARADLRGMFLRIECNEDFGLIEIMDNDIWGDKLGLYFNQGKRFYKYSIDTDGEDKSHAEIILINNETWQSDEPFDYVCQLEDGLKYEINIAWTQKNVCSDSSRINYDLSITEYRVNKDDGGIVSKKMMDKVALGCGGYKGVQLTERLRSEGADITFLHNDTTEAYFMYSDITEPLTTEMLDKEIKRLEDNLVVVNDRDDEEE
jgi:hypothetical protein